MSNPTLEKIIINIHPLNKETIPYSITCEHIAPFFLSATLQERIVRLLQEEFVKQGVVEIRNEH